MAFLAQMSFVALPSCFLIMSVTSAFAGQPQMIGKLGESVTLQCQAPREAVVTVLEWIRPDLNSDGYVFFYRNDRSYEKYQHLSFRGRVELSDPEMKDGDVSVILKNVTIYDTGTYVCRVTMSNTKPFNNTVSLNVVEPGVTVGKPEDGGKTEKVIQEGGNKAVNVGLVVGLSAAAAVFLCFVGFIIFRKYKDRLKQTFYQLAPNIACEQQQV